MYITRENFLYGLSYDPHRLPFSSLSGLKHTLISKGRQHTDKFRKPANTTLILCKVLLSALALADTQDASCYQLHTRFISTLSLRYSCSLCISRGQLYFHTRVGNTFA